MIYRLFVAILTLMGVLFAASGCGSGSGDGSGSGGDIVEYMSLLNVFPTPDAGQVDVSTSAAVQVHLNHDIDETTLSSGGFVLMGASPVPGSIIYDAAYRTMTFLPDEPLQAYTSYTAMLTTDLIDIEGLHLQEDYTWSFTTGPEILRASLNSADMEGNYGSGDADVSAGGTIVAFYSIADNLVSNDSNGLPDIFVRNMVTHETVRASVNPGGSQMLSGSKYPVVSDDGSSVAFYSAGYYVYDIAAGTTARVDVADPLATGGTSYPVIEDYPALSADGRYVAFQSAAGNLTPDDNSTSRDIFVRDRVLNTTTLVSVSTDEVQANHHSYSPSISADGRYIAFMSIANMLVADDTNGVSDIFVRDLVNGTTTRASVAAAGIIEANGQSSNPLISADGRYVSFTSEASNLVPDDLNNQADVFVYDYVTGITRRASVDSSGVEADGRSILSDMSSDGRYIVFSSQATNWDLSVENVNQGVRGNLYLHDMVTGQTRRLLIDVGVAGLYPSYGRIGTISPDGTYAAYSTDDSYLDGRDKNHTYDVFRESLSVQ